MKKFLSLVLALTLVMSAMCFTTALADMSDTIIVVGGKTENMDPYAANQAMDSLARSCIYDCLMQYDAETGEPVPCLAESMELSEDGTYYNVKLVEGVTFSDGAPFNADAVLYNYDKAINSTYLGYTYLSCMSSIEKVDDYNLKIYKAASYSSVPKFCCTYFPMVSPKSYENPDFATAPVGTGAYVVERFDPTTNYVYLTAREDYFQGAPTIKHIEVRVPLDSAVALVALENGEADLVTSPMSTDDRMLAADKGFNVMGTASWTAKTLLLWGEPFNSDRNLCLAINYAMNRENAALFNGDYDAVPATDYYASKMMGNYAGKVPMFNYDPAKAAEYLAASNYDGSVLEINVEAANEAAAVSLQADLDAIGIKTQINTVDANTWADKIYDASMQITVADYGVAYSSPEEMLSYFAGGGFYEALGLCATNEAYDENLKKAGETWVDEEREPYVLAAMEAARDLSQYIPMYDIVMQSVASPRLKGIDTVAPATYTFYMWRAYLEQ